MAVTLCVESRLQIYENITPTFEDCIDFFLSLISSPSQRVKRNVLGFELGLFEVTDCFSLGSFINSSPLYTWSTDKTKPPEGSVTLNYCVLVCSE